MSFSSQLPKKCSECIKSSRPFIHNKCDLCKDLGFQEEVLCNLNRCVQDPVEFACHAFHHILKLVSPSVQEVPILPDDHKEGGFQKSFHEVIHSDKIGYERALALQRLDRDQDAIYVELKYHLAWNVIHRKSVFVGSDNLIDFVSGTFSDCSNLVGGFVRLVWLAPDHLHLYVESDGDHSIESIAQEMKRLSASAILMEFPDLKANLGPGNELWDIAYFVETIG
jgi:REP element-mobilizing transposase RayT